MIYIAYGPIILRQKYEIKWFSRELQARKAIEYVIYGKGLAMMKSLCQIETQYRGQILFLSVSFSGAQVDANGITSMIITIKSNFT